MPTYDYECPKGHRFEVFQKMSDDPVATCPECGGPAKRKISGGAGFLFKGEGFYITDYRSDDYKKRASAEEPATSKPAASKSESSTKSESATKPESATKSRSATKSESGGKGSGGSSTSSDD
jgi:putative FmdB family regulatory protein